MKLYGNVMNRISEVGRQTTLPEVGMGLTSYSFSDRYAYTVTRIDPKGKKLWAKEDTAVRSDKTGMSDCQSYTYTENPNAGETMFTFRKDGKWHMGNKLSGNVARLGIRDKYHDFSF